MSSLAKKILEDINSINNPVNDNKSIKAGDYLVAKFGYNATSIGFYKVVGLTPSGKSAKIVPVGKKITYGNAHDGRCAIDTDKIGSKAFTSRIYFGDDYDMVKVGYNSYARKLNDLNKEFEFNSN